jgi:hypothetical protein
VLLVVEATLVGRGDEAVHAIEEVDHELAPPVTHPVRVAARARGHESPKVLIVESAHAR